MRRRRLGADHRDRHRGGAGYDYNADGSPSVGKAANVKIQPIMDEMNKLGTITANSFIDWLVY